MSERLLLASTHDSSKGEQQPQGAGISADDLHPPPGQEIMPGLAMFPDSS
jgi:hypothetical protein